MGKSKLVTFKISPKLLKKYSNIPVTHQKKRLTLTVKPESNDSSSSSSLTTTPKRLIAPKITAIVKPAGSPTPETPSNATPQPGAINNGKTGFGRSAISDDRKLDKTGRSVRKWIKKPLNIQSFTGYSISFNSWTGESDDLDIADNNGDVKEEEDQDDLKLKKNSKPPLAKIHLKLNNKVLELNPNRNRESVSRDQSPSLDDASSIVSTPDVSVASTPAP